MRIIRKSGLMIVLFLVAAFMLNAQEYSSSELAAKANKEGTELYQKGSYSEAAAKFEEAMNLFSKSEKEDGIQKNVEKDELIKQLINCNVKMGDFAKVAFYFEKQLEKKPNDYKLAYKISQVYRLKLGDFEKGIKVLVDLDNRKANINARKSLAKIYYNEKDYNNAIIWYNKVLEIKEDGVTMSKLANALIKAGQNEKAIVTLKNYIATNPSKNDKKRTYAALGKLYEDLADKKNAITYYEKSLSLSYDKKYNQKLVKMYFDSNNFKKAIESANLLMKKVPSNKDYATYIVALSLYKMNDKAASLAEFKKIENVKKYSKDAKQYIKAINQEI